MWRARRFLAEVGPGVGCAKAAFGLGLLSLQAEVAGKQKNMLGISSDRMQLDEMSKIHHISSAQLLGLWLGPPSGLSVYYPGDPVLCCLGKAKAQDLLRVLLVCFYGSRGTLCHFYPLCSQAASYLSAGWAAKGSLRGRRVWVGKCMITPDSELAPSPSSHQPSLCRCTC